MFPICDQCETEIAGGEVVVLEGAVLCGGCGWSRAAVMLEDFLHPAYTPLELRAQEYRDAWLVMEQLRARVEKRMREIDEARVERAGAGT